MLRKHAWLVSINVALTLALVVVSATRVRAQSDESTDREFEAKRDLMSLTEPIIVNCSGLGARDLFDDKEIAPYKGQLTLLVPQSEVDYETGGGLRSTSGHAGVSLHMTPRSDGIALGGTAELDEWSLEPNEESRKVVVEGHMELFSAMRRPSLR